MSVTLITAMVVTSIVSKFLLGGHDNAPGKGRQFAKPDLAGLICAKCGMRWPPFRGCAVFSVGRKGGECREAGSVQGSAKRRAGARTADRPRRGRHFRRGQGELYAAA